MAKFYSRLAVAALVVLVLALCYAQLVPPAQAGDDEVEPGILTVSGRGQVAVTPDTANLSFGTLTQARTAQEAHEANAALMSRVINALQQLGLTEAQMQTTGFSLEPIWDYSATRERGTPPQLVGYQVQNTLTVRTQRLEQVGRLIDAATRAGANTVNRLWFSAADNSAARLEALEQAYQDAFAKAERLTQAAGVRIISIKSMDEGSSYAPLPEYRTAADMAVPTPILPGEQEVSAYVTVRLVIK